MRCIWGDVDPESGLGADPDYVEDSRKHASEIDFVTLTVRREYAVENRSSYETGQQTADRRDCNTCTPYVYILRTRPHVCPNQSRLDLPAACAGARGLLRPRAAAGLDLPAGKQLPSWAGRPSK